jgi:hypothetical protein
MKIAYLAISIIFCFYLSACCTLEEKPLMVEINPDEKNQTFYIFSKPEQDVRNSIIEALGYSESLKGSRYENYMLVLYDTGVLKLLPIDGNLSKVFFRKNGEPYLFQPQIQIHLRSEKENETIVDINVLNPKVRTRLTTLPTPSHFQRAWKQKPVPATTVEEYEILLMIGKELDEKNMPEIKIPQKIVF